ncbi:HepT-like ribonuclease domain-containing protein [Desulfobacula sp.]
MYDPEILADLLNKIQDCLNKIQLRVQSIDTASDLTNSPKGAERLDLLCMPLIVTGELVKKIDKITDQSLLKNYPIIPWREIKGLRNIVVHDYFNIDAEEIFNTCKEDIPKLAEVIDLIISDLKANQNS